MSRKRGLGRGLDALIPSEPDQYVGSVEEDPSSPVSGLMQVPTGAIQPNPHQPRLSLDQDDLAELTASIREHGLIQPLIVTRAPTASPPGARFQLIAGERRWRAAKQAGMEQVPVIVKEVAPQEMLELALVENLQRADLNPLEEAHAFDHLIREFGLTQERVAERVGKSRVAVANTLRLLRASKAVQEALLSNEIQEGHARAVLALKTAEAQDAALAVVIRQGLNVRQTESLVRRLAGQRDEPPPPPPSSSETQRLEDSFREALGTKVSLRRSKKGAGQVVIHFFSDEELQSIYDRIVGDG